MRLNFYEGGISFKNSAPALSKKVAIRTYNNSVRNVIYFHHFYYFQFWPLVIHGDAGYFWIVYLHNLAVFDVILAL